MNGNRFAEAEIALLVKHYVDHIEKDKAFYIKDEGYKYGAVATFRKHFDLKAPDLAKMLEEAFSDAGNLVSSGRYFPKRMLVRYAEKDPKFVRRSLRQLLDHSGNVGRRIDRFVTEMNAHFKERGLQSYLDYRFISFILAALSPERYIYAKARETKKFANFIKYPLNPSQTNGERYIAYLEFAELLRSVLACSPEFLATHGEIVAPYDYKDPSLSWGVLDFIFNCVRRLEDFKDFEASAGVRESYRAQMNEQYEEMVFADEFYDQLDQMSKDEILKQALAYKAEGDGYKVVAKTGRMRIDSAVQKLRVKKLEDYTCQVCGTVIEYRNAGGKLRRFAHADHIKEKEKGGTEELSNLWVLCPNCHALKTYRVIVVDKNLMKVYKNGEELSIRDNHLGWNKETIGK